MSTYLSSFDDNSSQRSASPPPSPAFTSSAASPFFVPSSPSPAPRPHSQSHISKRSSIPSSSASPGGGGGVAGAAMQRAASSAGERGLAHRRGERSKYEKIDQIIQHFYAKVTQAVAQSRVTPIAPSTKKSTRIDKWFGLEIEDSDFFKEDLKAWKNMSNIIGLSSSSSSHGNISFNNSPSPYPSTSHNVPDLVIEILAEADQMTLQQTLVLTDPQGRRVKVDESTSTGVVNNLDMSQQTLRRKKKTRVVVERWTLSFEPTLPTVSPDLPLVYKKCILLFRSLYTILRTLPTWSLYRSLSRRSNVKLIPRLVTGDTKDGNGLGNGNGNGSSRKERENEVGLDTPILQNEEQREGASETFKFHSILTPLGELKLQCSYRLNVDFAVEDLEAIATSRFIEEDMFKPTVERFRMSAGSLPTGKSPTVVAVEKGRQRERDEGERQTYGSLSSRHWLNQTAAVSGGNSRVGKANIGRDGTDAAEIQRPSAPGPLQRPAIPFATTPKKVGGGAGPTPPGSISSGSQRFGSYGDVEPAFVASRSRTQSLGMSASGRDAVGALPVRQQPSTTTTSTRMMVGSPSTSSVHSPLFRPGSYVGSRHQTSPSSGSASPSTSLNRPISVLFPQPSRTTTTTTNSVPSPRPIVGSVPGRRYSTGKYANSYGHGSSIGSNEQFPPDNSPSRSSWDAGPTAEASSATSVGSGLIVPAADDTEDIHSFLRMIDSRPQLVNKSSRRSRVVSKSQADEALRRIQGSMMSSLLADQGFAAAATSRRSKLSLEGGGRAEVVMEEDEEVDRQRTNSPESSKFRSRPPTLSSRNNSFSSARATGFPSYGSSNSLRRLAQGEGGGSSSIDDGPFGRLELRDEFEATQGSGDESSERRRWNLRREV